MQECFEYDFQFTVNSTLDVEEIGQCYLEASTDAGNFYYACVKTVMGRSVLLEFGPVCEVPPATWMDSFFTFNRSNIAFDERKISRFIDKFLNNTRLAITQAQEITEEVFLEKLEEFEYNNCNLDVNI